MNTENLLIATSHPEFSGAAGAELKQLDKRLTNIEELAPGITLYATPDVPALMRRVAREHPIFIRHLAPAQTVVDLSNEQQDLGILATTIADLPTFALLERGIRFAVQSRFVQTDKTSGERPYSSGRLNQALAKATAEETAAIEDIKKPQVIISILCTMHKAYLGISTAKENLVVSTGGTRHFAQTPEQMSRAEFKLLEALDVFGIMLPSEGYVLDLGAAPGGWTRLLLETGMHVVAVDPANLDPRLTGRTHLEHYQGCAKTTLRMFSKGGVASL